MFNDISTNADDISEISNEEDAKQAENTEGNDILGSSSGGLPPVGMVLIGGAAFNSSPVTMVPSLDKGSVTESPNVNAFKAPYEQTDEGVHLSIPAAPAAKPIHTDFNFNCDDGADSDEDVGPFFDAVEGPIGVLLIEGSDLVVCLNVNAFKALYEQTDEGVHVSIPVAPVVIPIRTDFNLNYDDGADSDEDVGPFFDAVEGEDVNDSDDDAELVWSEPEQVPEPPALTGTTQETTLLVTERHLMLMSNLELKEECRRWNLSKQA